MSRPFILCISLNARAGYSAAAIVEQPRWPPGASSWHFISAFDYPAEKRKIDYILNEGNVYDAAGKSNYPLRLQYLDRWTGVSHDKIFDDVGRVLAGLLERAEDGVVVLIELTQYGSTPAELFQEKYPDLRPVSISITGEQQETELSGPWDATWLGVPKHVCIASASNALDTNRVAWPASLPHRQTLEKELHTYTPKPSKINPDLFEIERRPDDDLVLSFSLACWYSIKHNHTRIFL